MSHLIVNGFVASLILFGTLLVLSVFGTSSIDAKRRRNFGEKWKSFAAVTSNIPFAAIMPEETGGGPFSLRSA